MIYFVWLLGCLLVIIFFRLIVSFSAAAAAKQAIFNLFGWMLIHCTSQQFNHKTKLSFTAPFTRLKLEIRFHAQDLNFVLVNDFNFLRMIFPLVQTNINRAQEEFF